ncbi:MAG: type II toxin-antitoxin system RelE/ParE family toxin [Parachlamydiales bacterium]
MTYRIEFEKRAAKAFEQLPASRQRLIEKKIDSLAHQPRPNGSKKLSGGDGIYRIRCGDYRILYQVQDHRLLVLVVKLGHRREVYD